MESSFRRPACACLLGVLLSLTACATEPAAPPARISPEQVAQAAFERARELYRAGDYPGAARLLEVLAARGHPESQYALGYMYLNGLGVPRNEREALRWITAAAASGHPGARQALRVLEGDAGETPGAQ